MGPLRVRSALLALRTPWRWRSSRNSCTTRTVSSTPRRFALARNGSQPARVPNCAQSCPVGRYQPRAAGHFASGSAHVASGPFATARPWRQGWPISALTAFFSRHFSAEIRDGLRLTSGRMRRPAGRGSRHERAGNRAPAQRSGRRGAARGNASRAARAQRSSRAARRSQRLESARTAARCSESASAMRSTSAIAVTSLASAIVPGRRQCARAGQRTRSHLRNMIHNFARALGPIKGRVGAWQARARSLRGDRRANLPRDSGTLALFLDVPTHAAASARVELTKHRTPRSAAP